MLDPVTRQQLLNGDWAIAPMGNIFHRDWFPIVEQAPVQAVRCRFWDCAATAGGGDYSVGAKVSRTPEGIFYVEHVTRGQWSPGELEKIIMQTTVADGREIKSRMEQEGGSSGKTVIADWMHKLAGFDFCGVPATGAKELRWNPLARQAEAGNVRLIRGPWNMDFIDEMCAVPLAGNDDQADATSGAFNELALGFFRKAGDDGWS